MAVCPACERGIVLVHGHPGYCFGCGFVYERVAWPSDGEMVAIVEQLEARPSRATQNWEPGETVDELRHDTERLAQGAKPQALVREARARRRAAEKGSR
jgi:predicted Fe-S protein YdhL (DUF1289 family)